MIIIIVLNRPCHSEWKVTKYPSLAPVFLLSNFAALQLKSQYLAFHKIPMNLIKALESLFFHSWTKEKDNPEPIVHSPTHQAKTGSIELLSLSHFPCLARFFSFLTCGRSSKLVSDLLHFRGRLVHVRPILSSSWLSDLRCTSMPRSD